MRRPRGEPLQPLQPLQQVAFVLLLLAGVSCVPPSASFQLSSYLSPQRCGPPVFLSPRPAAAWGLASARGPGAALGVSPFVSAAAVASAAAAAAAASVSLSLQGAPRPAANVSLLSHRGFPRLAASVSSVVESSAEAETQDLPLWGRLFARKFLFKETLPSVIPSLHAALFAEANVAARRSWGFGVFRGGTAAAAAAAAACLAAFGSRHLLGLAARSFRGFTTQHRIAEARAYGPLHSLDATLKPIPSEATIPAASKKPQGCSNSSKGNSSSSNNNNNSSSSSSSGLPLPQPRLSAPRRGEDTEGPEASAKGGKIDTPSSKTRKNTKASRGPQKTFSEQTSDSSSSSSNSSSSNSSSSSSSGARKGRKGNKGRDVSPSVSEGGVAEAIEPQTRRAV